MVALTVNYRLGVFGFMAHPELTKESPHHASGNQGLLDQSARWCGSRRTSRRSAESQAHHHRRGVRGIGIGQRASAPST